MNLGRLLIAALDNVPPGGLSILGYGQPTFRKCYGCLKWIEECKVEEFKAGYHAECGKRFGKDHAQLL